MSTPEFLIGTVLQVVCPRVHLNEAPAGVARPYIVVQYLPGGRPMVFMNKTKGDKEHILMQVSVWGDDGESVLAVSRSAMDALMAATTVSARPVGSLHSGSDEDTGRHSATQDFEVFAPR